MAGTVVVACKHPNGMILRLFDMVKVMYDVQGGGKREVEEARERPGSKHVVINGPATPFGGRPKGPIEGGYVLTFGVDAEFFAEWMKQHRDTDYVKNQIIKGYNKEADAVVESRKLESVKTGLEPIDPSRPPAEFARRRQVGEGASYSPITPDTGTL